MPGRRLRIAICGAGSAAVRAHLPALVSPAVRDAVSVVGVCDHDRPRAEAAISKIRGAAAFADVNALLEGAAPDVLVVATPPAAHREAIAAAVERGVHVLCEKPVAIANADVASLRDLRERHPDTVIASVLQYRHAPTWRRFREATTSVCSDDQPFRLSVSVERPGTDPLSTGGWRTEPLTQGGILGDHAVHYLGLCWDIDRNATVRSCRRWGDGATERAALAVAVSGGTVDIEVSYQGAERRNVIALELPAHHPTLRWENRELLTGAGREHVESLSDRTTVNALYRDLYSEVIANIGDRAWRSERSAETCGVTGLLTAALTAAGAGISGGRVP